MLCIIFPILELNSLDLSYSIILNVRLLQDPEQQIHIKSYTRSDADGFL